MNKILYFVCCRSSSPAFCVTREEKCPTLSPLASLWISQQVTQIPPTPPLAEFCVLAFLPALGELSSANRPTKPRKPPGCPQKAPCGRFPSQVGNDPPRPDRGRFGPHRGKFGRSHRRSREAGKPFSFFCFSQAGNKRHRSLKPTHSSLLGRASRAPARRCRSAQKAGRSRLPARSARGRSPPGTLAPHPLCRKERSL